jgi:outer membrane protein assembly factor BamB
MLLLTKWRAELFPKGIEKDEHYFYKIENQNFFCFTPDTVSREHTKVNHVINGNMISTDGTTTFRADDKRCFCTYLDDET